MHTNPLGKTVFIQMDAMPVTDITYTSAEVEHFRKVICEMPSDLPPHIVSIRISNDNITFSNEKLLIVYDSTCWNCSLNDGCVKKVKFSISFVVSYLGRGRLDGE